MIWQWMLGVILVLLLLLLLTRIGAQAAMHDGVLRVDIRVGLLRFRVLPAKKKAEKKPKPDKKGTKQAAEKPEQKPKIAFADIKDAIQTLWPPLKRALNRTRKGIRIHPLTVSLTLGAANDPASGAEQYGYLHAGVWTVMPMLERLLVIPEPSIHIGIDFDTPDTVMEGEVGFSACVGTLLGVVLTVAIPALRWFLRWRKKMKQSPALSNQTEQQAAA